MNKSLEKVLKKMFKLVKAPFPKDESYFKKEGWFYNYSVTEKQRDNFIKWMIAYLEKNRQARLDIFDMRWKDKRRIKRGVEEFCFNYFWRIKIKKTKKTDE